VFSSVGGVNLSLVHDLASDEKFGLENYTHHPAIQVGSGDTVDSTVLHVPELSLVVGGDIVYGYCYQYLAEDPTLEARKQWLRSVEEIKALRPRYVIPHM
jgi:hypothetical protein